MRIRRLLPALVAAALPLAGAAPPATAAGPTVSAPTSYHVTRDVRITMDDGASLDSDEYVPDHGCPCPTILVQTPYRKGGSVAEYNPYFPAHGYAEIVVDVRGTGSSEGYWDSFGPREQRDSVALVQWSARRPFSNGKLGLAGLSYGAINQLLTVEQPGTEAVKAIFPVVPGSDPYRDVTFAGGNTDSGFIPLWLGLVTGLSAPPTDDAQANPQVALNAESQHLYNVTRFQAPVLADSTAGAYEHQLPAPVQVYPDQAYDGPFYQVRAPITHIENVHIPTFIVGGEYDLFQRGEPILYRALGLPTTQKKFMYGPWYHVTAGQGLTADDGSNPVRDSSGRTIPSLNNLQLAWFDHWLKGYANGVDAFPTVETYHLGVNQWVASTAFPAPGSRVAPMYLGPAGTLDRSPSRFGGTQSMPVLPTSGACSRSTEQWTAGLGATNGSWSPCDGDNRLSDAQSVTFTTAPATAPLTIGGPISARLFVGSTRPDLTAIVTLTDVAPDGTSASITAGSLVASLRALTTSPCGAVVRNCSLYAGSIPLIPWHPYTRASQKPLDPGLNELWVEIFPTSAVIQPGHRLRVSIQGADLPHESNSASTAAESAGAVFTVGFGAKTPSAVYLPAS